jgi:ankyrin repeat protein
MPRLSRADAHRLLGQARNVALSKAVEKAPLSKIQAAVRAGANVNNLDADESPLMRATSRGSLPIMRFLLARGAQVNLRDSGGRAALMYAGDNDSAEPARLLLQHGAKISLRDHSGMTALMYAAHENWRATALLIAHGAQVNARDQSGRTALHWAATLRDSKSLQVLLHHGASINARDGQGETALMLASVQPDTPANARQQAARRDLLKLLVRAGASSHLKDKRGRTSSAYSKMHDMDFVSAG